MEEREDKQPQGRSMRWLLWGAAGVVTCMLMAWFVLFQVNQFELSVCLTGQPEVMLEFGESYSEPGAAVMAYGTLFWKEGIVIPDIDLRIISDVQEEKLGRYTVSYQAVLGKWTAEAERTVCIIDTECPVITLQDDPDHALLKGRAYLHSGFTATDNYDGDITDRVTCTVSDNVATYSVIDSSGNPAYAERVIPSDDVIPPDILLVGGPKLSVTVGDYTADPGYEAADDVDGDLTDKVKVEGEILWLIPGNYQAVYSVADSSGNEVSVTREVTVTAMERPAVEWPYGKAMYLTFDDGPGPYTLRLLDVLDRYGVKATFFVTDSGYDGVMREIVKRGHSIGIHTVSHNYSVIYESAEKYFEDLKQMQNIIYENTGVRTTLMRFPGGSSNTVSYYSNRGLMTFLTQAVQDAGFQYFDWNVDSGDAGEASNWEDVAENIKKGVVNQGVSAVLQHDIFAYSVEAVEDIILWGKANGYSFLPLTPNSPGFHHRVRN